MDLLESTELGDILGCLLQLFSFLLYFLLLFHHQILFLIALNLQILNQVTYFLNFHFFLCLQRVVFGLLLDRLDLVSRFFIGVTSSASAPI